MMRWPCSTSVRIQKSRIQRGSTSSLYDLDHIFIVLKIKGGDFEALSVIVCSCSYLSMPSRDKRSTEPV